MKEVKFYEKHGGDFLWGPAQEGMLVERVETAKENYMSIEDKEMKPVLIKEMEKLEKGRLKEEISAMEILKRANNKRFGNLQISLKNSNLLGKNGYTTTIADLLKVLNNYKPE